MLKKETLEMIRKMLKELGWSDEVINKYMIDSLHNIDETQVIG